MINLETEKSEKNAKRLLAITVVIFLIGIYSYLYFESQGDKIMSYREECLRDTGGIMEETDSCKKQAQELGLMGLDIIEVNDKVGKNFHNETASSFVTVFAFLFVVYSFVNLRIKKWQIGVAKKLEKEREKNFKDTGLKETNFEKYRRNQIDTERREIQEAAEEAISQGGLQNYQTAKNLYTDKAYLFGENHYKTVLKLKMKIAKELERLLRYEEAIEAWEDLENHDEAARVRKLEVEQGAVKVSQKVVHGDEVTKTEIKDSVLNRSNVGGKSSKAEELREAKSLLDEGLINENDYEKMKNEILGK